ncbi:hypothetical protein [Salmonirosea aquatica]|uniref:Bacteriophage tail tape measure N-terminal domain-containing protein n=1 Tax=Salmonirosea aquatica TaxID=2654236 RepID=A0A7C9FZZ1_9BACT|nr:hypothetical protein [Cytophagaceae bacterium SJW1-29]
MTNDQIKIEMLGDATKLQNEIDSTNTKAKELRKTIKEIELDGGKGSEKWQKYKAELKGTEEAAKKLALELKQMNVADMTIRQLEQHAKALAKELKNADRSSQDFATNSKRLGEVEQELAKANKQAKELKGAGDDLAKPGLWGKISSGVKSVGTAFQAIMALQILQFIISIGTKIFETTAKFEKYGKVLETALGSQKEAKQSMEAIKKMAAETAFSVDELTDGYVKMVNRGLRPSQKEMVALADLAASQGKTFDQLVEAVLDAQQGEFERLKEFGIKAKKEGDNVSLSFKGQTQTVKNNEQAIYDAMIAMGAMTGVAGQNAEMMQTLDGKSSNLGDSFDALTVELGTGLKPVFIAIIDLIQMALPLIGFLGKAIGTVVLVAKSLVMGVVDTVMNAGKSIFSLVEAGKLALEGNLSGAKTAMDQSSKYAEKSVLAIKNNVQQGAKEIANMWVNPDAAVKAEFAGKKQGDAYQGQLTDAQKKEAAKREKEAEKEAAKKKKIEEKNLEDIGKANEKALELLAQLEAEHDQKTADNSLEVETAKIEEKRRKRLKEINDSLADEKNKEAARVAINRNADAELEKAQADFLKKKRAAEAEAAQKRLEAENFIRGQERQAEMALLDWKEIQARGNATKLVAIKKERLDLELRFLKEKLEAERLAESQKAATEITDLEQLAVALNAIDARYQQEAVTAEAKTAAEKLAIDKDLQEKKKANLKAYSDMFASLLKGDLDGFMSTASSMLQGHKTKLQEQMSADMQYYEMGAQAATQAVAFLNNLAQQKAEKHIAEAARERDAKLGILQNELTVTESLITSSSNYVQALKDAETARLTELQRILTSETTSEEEKRDALKRYYSEQFQQMKAAEEQKIKDLQHEANLAKTEDEKQAIEAKIKLAKEESETKVKLAEEELESKKKTIDELTTFTTETTEAVLAEATEASETQVKLAEDEAQQKYDTKVDLEEAIAEENRIYREKESAEKKKAWEAQKKADIATALITGALAILKALANFFPLNIVLAATAGVVTAIQINKIKNQTPPQFDHGGFVARGGRHGSQYGQGGIQLIDRASGREVGEMEGDEAIVSREQTEANWPIIERMFRNARTPGMRDKPVAAAPPMAFRDGGRFESPYFEKSMYLFGIKKKKKEAEEMARQAEADAAKAAAEAEAMMDSYGFDDAGAYGGIDQGGVGINGDTAAAQAAHEKAQKQGEMQLQLLQDIVDGLVVTVEKLDQVSTAVVGTGNEMSGGLSRVESAVRSVEGAVNAANTQGRFSELIGAISSLGGTTGG